ncbi:MAG: hypothetical protein IIY21_04485 [Clostridiales bacterium]|nr:hypothetical protein [Clostridiales bacterium]MBQ1573856.1 hypothetical protein [Clostridiales bacterium]
MTENGYIPHIGSAHFRCINCGGDSFRSHPQCAPIDAKCWTWEFYCERCKQIMTLTIRKD